MDHIQVMWLACGLGLAMGIVKVWDKIDGCWKFYIGAGQGFDQDADVQFIRDFGQKFYSLEAIAAFGDLTPPEG